MKFYYVRLFFKEKYYNIIVIGNENKQMWFATVHNRVQLWESEVVFMVDFLSFLIIGFMISVTINVALLTVIFIMWTNKE